MPKVKSRPDSSCSLRQVRLYKKDVTTSASDNLPSADDQNCETELKSFLNNGNNVNRWLQRLSNNDNVNITFLKILGEMQGNIIDRIGLLEINIKSTIEKRFETTNNSNYVNTYFSDQITSLRSTLNVRLPINDFDTFIQFNMELDKDIKKRDALRNLFSCLLTRSNHLGNNISAIIDEVSTKHVQKYYSGLGRKYQDRHRNNFSITNVYLCMEDALIHKYNKSATDLKIIAKVSRWFSQRNFFQ